MVVAPAPAVMGWRCVGLSYSVPWPLHLVITDRALEEYNRYKVPGVHGKHPPTTTISVNKISITRFCDSRMRRCTVVGTYILCPNHTRLE